MFKCTDCNKKYQIKPDFCDCGNNIFEAEAPLQSEKIVTKKTFLEQYPQVKNFIDSVDILSGIIFVSCLILSVFAWNIIGSWKPAPTSPIKPAQQETKTSQDASIPDINNLWNSAPPKQIQPKSEPVSDVLPQAQEQPPVQSAPPEVIKSTPKPPVQQTKPKSNLLNKNQSSMSSQLKNYTEGLKEALFSQWAVGSISGSGLCEVEFSVSPSGKLLGRRFSKQSDNESLNGATYDALMNVPQYSPPPRDYNGEKIRISFAMNNGYYEVKMPRY